MARTIGEIVKIVNEWYYDHLGIVKRNHGSVNDGDDEHEQR